MDNNKSVSLQVLMDTLKIYKAKVFLLIIPSFEKHQNRRIFIVVGTIIIRPDSIFFPLPPKRSAQHSGVSIKACQGTF
jgi:hypothetical protein